MNNNNLLIISNAVLGIAVAILFILHFSSKTPENKNTEDQNSTLINPENGTKENALDISDNASLSNIGASFSNLKIAFVNSDTLAKYYTLQKELKDDLLKKQSKAESQIKKKYAQYQKLVSEYQQAAEIMGQNEAAEKAQTIALLEQEIMQLEQKLSQNLADEELKATNNFVTVTDKFLQKIGANLGFDYVLSYRLGGPMLYANPALDITQEILTQLNEAYEKNNQ